MTVWYNPELDEIALVSKMMVAGSIRCLKEAISVHKTFKVVMKTHGWVYIGEL